MAWARRRPDISERAAIIGNWEWCAADTPDERRESTHGGMIYEDHFLGSGTQPVGLCSARCDAGWICRCRSRRRKPRRFTHRNANLQRISFVQFHIPFRFRSKRDGWHSLVQFRCASRTNSASGTATVSATATEFSSGTQSRYSAIRRIGHGERDGPGHSEPAATGSLPHPGALHSRTVLNRTSVFAITYGRICAYRLKRPRCEKARYRCRVLLTMDKSLIFRYGLWQSLDKRLFPDICAKILPIPGFHGHSPPNGQFEGKQVSGERE